MSKKAINLFSYSDTYYSFVKYFDALQNDYEINRVFSLSGLGLCEKDISHSRNYPNIGKMVYDASELCEDTIRETLVVIDYQFETSISFLDGEIFKRYINNKTKVIIMDESIKPALAFMPKQQVVVKNNQKHRLESTLSSLSASAWKELTPAVILIGGLVSKHDTSIILHELAATMKEQGVRPLVFANNPNGSLFGFYTFNDIWNNHTLTESEKILALRKRISDLDEIIRPDVIIVEGPDPIMRYSDRVPNGYGIMTYMLTLAARPRFLICSVPFDFAEPQMIDAISKDFRVRLGTEIGCWFIENNKLDSSEILQSHTLSFLRVNYLSMKEKVREKLGGCSIPYFFYSDNFGDEVLSLLFRKKVIKRKSLSD